MGSPVASWSLRDWSQKTFIASTAAFVCPPKLDALCTGVAYEVMARKAVPSMNSFILYFVTTKRITMMMIGERNIILESYRVVNVEVLSYELRLHLVDGVLRGFL